MELSVCDTTSGKFSLYIFEQKKFQKKNTDGYRAESPKFDSDSGHLNYQ